MMQLPKLIQQLVIPFVEPRLMHFVLILLAQVRSPGQQCPLDQVLELLNLPLIQTL